MARCRAHNIEIPDALLLLHILEHQITLEELVMTDFTAVNAALDTLQATETSAVAALNDLSAKLGAAGNTDDQAAVDAITAKLTGMSSDLATAVSTDDPAPAPVEPAPPVEPSA